MVRQRGSDNCVLCALDASSTQFSRTPGISSVPRIVLQDCVFRATDGWPLSTISHWGCPGDRKALLRRCVRVVVVLSNSSWRRSANASLVSEPLGSIRLARMRRPASRTEGGGSAMKAEDGWALRRPRGGVQLQLAARSTGAAGDDGADLRPTPSGRGTVTCAESPLLS